MDYLRVDHIINGSWTNILEVKEVNMFSLHFFIFKHLDNFSYWLVQSGNWCKQF